MRVAAIGDNCMDVYPRLGRSYPTGNAVDFAVHMKRFGIDTSIISVTGNDENGSCMAKTLMKERLDMSHFYVGKGATAVTYMDMEGNDRIHGEYVEGVLADMAFSEADIRFAGEHDLVHTAFWGKAEHFLGDIRSMGARISFDYATKLEDAMVETTLPFVDYAFFSYPGGRDSFIEGYLKRAAAKGVKIAVATFGEKGSLAYDGSKLYEYGIVESKVVNTVGAGDSFIAGFIYGVMAGFAVEDCLKAGARISSRVVRVFEPWEP